MASVQIRAVTGRDFEEEVFGIRGKKHTGHWSLATFEEALLYTISHQPWNPSSPQTVIACRLYDLVDVKIRSANNNPLSLCVSIGQTLDYLYGIDAFFLHNSRFVPIDVTLWDGDIKKKHNPDIPDIVIIKKEDIENEKLFEEKAFKIAERLKTDPPITFLMGVRCRYGQIKLKSR